MARYIIQLFHEAGSVSGHTVGKWEATDWGGSDLKEVLSRAENVADTIREHRSNITSVRVVEVVAEYKAK